MNKLFLLALLALVIMNVSSFKLRMNEANGTDSNSTAPAENSTDSGSTVTSQNDTAEDKNSSDVSWSDSLYDYESYLGKNHSIYYSTGCCISAFNNKTYEGIHDIILNGLDQSGEDGCWSYIFEGYNVTGCEYEYGNYTDGYATDGVNHFYYLINYTHPDATHGEMYDWHHEPRQTWGVDLENIEDNTLDNEFMVYFKDVYEMGYLYYEPDGVIYMSDPTATELTGYLFPDEHGIFDGYEEETGEYISGEFECRGAQGYYYVYTYDEEGEYVEIDFEEWDYECDEYKAHCTCALDFSSEQASRSTEEYDEHFHNFNDFVSNDSRLQAQSMVWSRY